MSDVTLRPVDIDSAIDIAFLYTLLQERTPEESISHVTMPSQEKHTKFVRGRPYRAWCIVEDDGLMVGATYLTWNNELGIAIAKPCRGKGYATHAIRYITTQYKPMGAVASLRTHGFVAHVNPRNEASIRLFARLGAKLKQQTFEL